MMTGCPMRLPTPSAPARPMRSFAPPGANGTIHFTGWSGQSAACAMRAATPSTAAAARRAGIRYMGAPPGKGAIIASKSLDAFYAAWQHSPISDVRSRTESHEAHFHPPAEPAPRRMPVLLLAARHANGPQGSTALRDHDGITALH